MFLAATFAFLRLTGSSAHTLLLSDKTESWLVKDYYEADKDCASSEVTSSSYFKLSETCSSSQHAVSCHNDPNGISNSVVLVFSDYGTTSNCYGDARNAVSQTVSQISAWNTACKTTSESSAKYRCINLPEGQLPFSTDSANTLVRLQYVKTGCVMDVNNVLAANITFINKCEASDSAFTAAQAGAKSRKISDCGFVTEYFSDSVCGSRAGLTTSTAALADYTCTATVTGGFVASTQYPNYVAPASQILLCPGGNYGAYANSGSYQYAAPATKKKSGDVVLSSNNDLGEEVRLVLQQVALEQQLALQNQLQVAADADSVDTLSVETQQITPMNYAYMGSCAFVGIVIGAVVSAKFFKSKTQFEGVEMQSAHSSI